MPNARAVRRVLHLAKGVYVGWRYSAGTGAERASPFCLMQRWCRKTCGVGGADETGGTDKAFATSTAA